MQHFTQAFSDLNGEAIRRSKSFPDLTRIVLKKYRLGRGFGIFGTAFSFARNFYNVHHDNTMQTTPCIQCYVA